MAWGFRGNAAHRLLCGRVCSRHTSQRLHSCAACMHASMHAVTSAPSWPACHNLLPILQRPARLPACLHALPACTVGMFLRLLPPLLYTVTTLSMYYKVQMAHALLMHWLASVSFTLSLQASMHACKHARGPGAVLARAAACCHRPPVGVRVRTPCRRLTLIPVLACSS